MKAWLITWEWTGDHAAVTDPIVSIQNPHWRGDRVREYVEQLYIDRYSLQKRLDIAKDRKNNPYPAEFFKVRGGEFQGRITCGHNPHLYARLVDNLQIEKDSNGNERLVWDERPLPRSLKE